MKIFDFGKQDIRLGINLFKMNIRDRYLGSSLGAFWAVFNPLFMLAVYTFVFGFVFKVRLPGAETTLAYVVWLISGYGPWIAMTEAIMSSTNSVSGSSGLVKNMAFKTELLPMSSVFVGLINLVVSLVFLMVLIVASGGHLSWYLLYLPIIILVQFQIFIGVGLILSAVNVFVRDLVQVLPTLLMICMFMTPVFYAVESLPVVMQKITFANPFYHMIELYRSVLIRNEAPSIFGLGYLAILGTAISAMGLLFFRRLKGHFDSAL
jgi:lipopolysaccharide transport system permease protein